MNVGVSYALKDKQVWLELQVPDGSTVNDVITASGVLDIFPEIDLDEQKVGIFGKITKLNNAVQEGDRIEIYRMITADPKKVKRRDRNDDDEDDDD
ncbi:MAG: RnfH family protein [Gammaproteobacteria bacterium]|nr:RnfH family protein [Gammaproteobacteria bacterium]